jgi:hypothetical protein
MCLLGIILNYDKCLEAAPGMAMFCNYSEIIKKGTQNERVGRVIQIPGFHCTKTIRNFMCRIFFNYRYKKRRI